MNEWMDGVSTKYFHNCIHTMMLYRHPQPKELIRIILGIEIETSLAN